MCKTGRYNRIIPLLINEFKNLKEDTILFYFTGTGNSLYIAKQLDEEIISIPQVIHQEDLNFKADKIGIVAPVYGHEVPNMVKDFLRKAHFDTDYFYIVLTYGNRHGGASELAQNFF